MTKYLLILVKYARKIFKSTRRSCKYLAIQNFPERKWSPHLPGMRWDNFSSHYTVCQWGFYPIVKTCKMWVMTLSSSMAMYSVMRDIPDARKVPIERGWVALHLYATCKFSNHLTLEQWAFEYGLPLFWYALYVSIPFCIRMLKKNKAQIARESIKTPESFQGPSAGPGLRSSGNSGFALVMKSFAPRPLS